MRGQRTPVKVEKKNEMKPNIMELFMQLRT